MDVGWQERAACIGQDPDLFFPEDYRISNMGQGEERPTRGELMLASAKAICGGCGVRSDCLQYALETDERYGIYGGLDGTARRRMREAARKKRSRASQADLREEAAGE